MATSVSCGVAYQNCAAADSKKKGARRLPKDFAVILRYLVNKAM